VTVALSLSLSSAENAFCGQKNKKQNKKTTVQIFSFSVGLKISRNKTVQSFCDIMHMM